MHIATKNGGDYTPVYYVNNKEVYSCLSVLIGLEKAACNAR